MELREIIPNGPAMITSEIDGSTITITVDWFVMLPDGTEQSFGFNMETDDRLSVVGRQIDLDTKIAAVKGQWEQHSTHPTFFIDVEMANISTLFLATPNIYIDEELGEVPVEVFDDVFTEPEPDEGE